MPKALKPLEAPSNAEDPQQRRRPVNLEALFNATEPEQR